MLRQLKVVVRVSKGSPLTGSAWVDILFGGIRVVERAEVTEAFGDPNEINPTSVEFIAEYDDQIHTTLTVVNTPETIGPIQTYGVEFYLDDQQVNLNWHSAIKTKPLRFGGAPNEVITNPYVGDEKFKGWASVPNISPGMSITWSLEDLVTV
jgi:hypothetical protein